MHAVLRRQLSVAKMLKRAMDCYQQGYLFVDVSAPGWRIMHVNQAFSTCTGTLLVPECSVLGIEPRCRVFAGTLHAQSDLTSYGL